MITSDVSFLSEEVFTRSELTCSEPVEFRYHAAPILTQAGCSCQFGETTESSTKTWRKPIPLCIKYKAKGKTAFQETWLYYSARKETTMNFELYLNIILCREYLLQFQIMWIVILCGNCTLFKYFDPLFSFNLTPALEPQYQENGNNLPNLSTKAPSSNKTYHQIRPHPKRLFLIIKPSPSNKPQWR